MDAVRSPGARPLRRPRTARFAWRALAALLAWAPALASAAPGGPAPEAAPPDAAPPDAAGWPAWATTPELRDLAAPVLVVEYGDQIRAVPARTPDARQGPTAEELRAKWAALPPNRATDCPLETYRLVATRRRSITVEAPDGGRLDVRVGQDVGGGWRTWGWVPRYRLVGVEPGGDGAVGTATLEVRDEFPDTPRRRTWEPGAPAELPDHPAFTPPALEAGFDHLLGEQQLDGPPPPELLAALLRIDGNRRGHVAVGCTEAGNRCLVRAETHGLEQIAAVLSRLGLPAYLVAVEGYDLHLPAWRPCHEDTVVRRYVYVLDVRLDGSDPRPADPGAAPVAPGE